MFNNNPFNSGRLNVNKNIITSNTNLTLDSEPVIGTRTFSIKGVSELKLEVSGFAIRNIYNFEGISELTLESSGFGTKVFISNNIPPSELILGSKGMFIVLGETLFILDNLNLQPGDELVINTCNITMTINGVNKVKLIENGSVFPDLRKNINTLKYQDLNANRNISLDILWKEKWF